MKRLALRDWQDLFGWVKERPASEGVPYNGEE